MNPTANELLIIADGTMKARGTTYDKPKGERSMGKIVSAFNTITEHQLTEAQGYLFMVILKAVRDSQRVEPHEDSCIDLCAYSALYGESRLKDSQ